MPRSLRPVRFRKTADLRKALVALPNLTAILVDHPWITGLAQVAFELGRQLDRNILLAFGEVFQTRRVFLNVVQLKLRATVNRQMKERRDPGIVAMLDQEIE